MKAGKLSALPLLFLLVCTALEAQAQSTPPTVVVRINSIDSLIDHVKFLVGLAGQKDAARQIEGLIKTKIGDKGLEGVDSRRPFGFYGRVGKELDDISGAVLLPIADEKAFLNLLQNVGVQVVMGADGVHTIKTGTPVDAYLRFANKYAYVTALNRAALEDKNLQDPVKVLAGKPTSAFALTIQLNQIPDAAKLIATAQAEQALQDAQAKEIPGESKAQKAFRAAVLKEIAKLIATVLRDGKELRTEVDLQQPSGELAATFALSGVPSSELAAGVEALAKSPSMFAGILRKDAAFNGIGRVHLPPGLDTALGDVIDEARVQALSKLQEPAKKQQVEALFKAINPTFKAGDFDGAIVVTTKDKHLNVVAAFKVKDGEQLGKTVRDMVSDSNKSAPQSLKEFIKLDADAVGATKIHKLGLVFLDAKLRALLGDPSLYVAFRDDALFISVGTDALDAIKTALPVKAAGFSPTLSYEVDVARLAFLIHPEQAEKGRKLFPDGQGGTVRFSVEGGPALTFRLNTKVSVLQFMGQIHEMK